MKMFPVPVILDDFLACIPDYYTAIFSGYYPDATLEEVIDFITANWDSV